jgi:hypothetical protein
MPTILGKRFGELTVEDVGQLVAEKHHEDRHLEYKRQLPSKEHGEAIRGFLESVASLANTEGGVIVYGVKEEHHVPVRTDGLTGAVADVENRRLESYARERIDPPVTNLIPHWHPWKDGKSILILEVPRSLAGPHGVEGTFYGRQTGAKYVMPTHQVRQLFLERDYWEQEAEDFRRRRIEGAISNEYGLGLSATEPCLFIHVLPLGRTREHDVAAEAVDSNWDERRKMVHALTWSEPWSPLRP